MSIWTDIEDHPGTIPFFGYPAAIEVDMDEQSWPDINFSKDMIIKMTFPKGVDDVKDVADRAVKYFDGEIISTEKHLIILKADLKMIGYTLLYSFRNQYHEI